MKQNNLGRFILVLAIIAWSLYAIYPPWSRDLMQEFYRRAQHRDATFTNIVTEASNMMLQGTNTFAAIRTAAGTNSLQRYFPIFNVGAQADPNLAILNRLQREAAGNIRLGLDLQGGTSFMVEMDTTALIAQEGTNGVRQASDITSEALAQAIQVLRNRIDRFGVAEPTFQAAGGNRILVQLPGLSQADRAIAEEQIRKPAYLEFRLVHENSAEIIRNGEPVPVGYVLMRQRASGNETNAAPFIVRKQPENNLAGDIVERATVGRGNMGALEINFTLTDDAARRFGQTTRDNIGRQLAIVLDGELQTAPSINSEISKSGQIRGNYTYEQALSIANVLQNPLRTQLRVLYSRDVDPTLGKDAIRSGVKASLYGVAFVSIFMLCYYFLAGLAANVALVTNIIILLGVMCSIGTTFTLPGIAGAVLTVGMAVDANVLIYERIREELAKGKSLRGAIEAGYARAFATIFDSHVTTLISSIILIYMGTGEIKGFGVTLTIGVAASLFTALVVTRLIFNFMLDRGWIKTLKMLHIIRSTKINFMGVAKPLTIATCLFVVLSLGFGVTRGKQLFGVDFLGGDSATYSFVQKQDPDKIRAVLAGIGEGDAQIQNQKDVGGSVETLRVTSRAGSMNRVQTALKEGLPQAQFKLVDFQQVGATLGREILFSAIWACLLAMFGILVYVAFRYEFSFAVAAVIAVLHDVLFTIGAYCIANGLTHGGRQFSGTVVAALLTIIGFSINDKIVIFDRIREDLKLGMRGTFREIINHALNQTLSRTIITSGTVFLATLSLYIFGGGAINDFALVFLIGIIVGTYSSIYIASVIVLWWHKGERPQIGASQVSVQGAATAKAAKG